MPLLSSYADRTLTRVLGHDKNNLVGKARMRELLTAIRTYYVRTDGNDANDGLTNSSGGAFLTIQRAMDVIASTLDLGGFEVTVQVGAGTYAAGFVINVWTGGGTITFVGDAVTPGNVIISTAGGYCVYGNHTGLATVRGFKIVSSAGVGIQNAKFGELDVDSCEFGACANFSIYCSSGYVYVYPNAFTISGGSPSGFVGAAGASSTVTLDAAAITVTGTPAFGDFASSSEGSDIQSFATFSGSATGQRYTSSLNAVINTFGGGANYFPGNSAGVTATGGQYA